LYENSFFYYTNQVTMIKLYILLGGNLGDKQQIFSVASEKLDQQIGPISNQSAIYETEPWGFVSDQMFWNQAIELETDLPAEEVLGRIHEIESELGRVRKGSRYHSRIIDIDVLFYGNQIISQPDLTIPHPRMQDRKFVLVPLSEIAPAFEHPVFRKTIARMLNECCDELKVEKLNIPLFNYSNA
jgi:2-amino-4-hydroxy-6-hydroxymethyldihydropteridine diphosphokinase